MSQAGSSNQRDPRVPDSTRLQGAGDERLVSIVVPCRNERGHIDAFLDSATAQQLPAGWRMEILVADGESDVLLNASAPCTSGETYVIEPDSAVAAKVAVTSAVPVAVVSGLAGIVPE